MTRTFFFIYSSLFALLTAYFIVYLLSPLPYPASANPSPLGIHKASSYLFTRFFAASSSPFFFISLALSAAAAAADLRVGKTLLGLFGVSPYRRETHTEAPPPLRPQEASGGTGLSFCVFPSLLLPPPFSPSRPPPLLLSLPSLPGGGRRAGTSMYKHTRRRTKK